MLAKLAELRRPIALAAIAADPSTSRRTGVLDRTADSSSRSTARRGAADVSRREAHGDRLRPPAVSRRRRVLPLPDEGHPALRQSLHHRTQRHAAGRRAGRRSRQPAHRRRHHRAVHRLQGVREPGRIQERSRLAARHAGRRARVRPVPRLRARDEAPGFRALEERAGHEHRELQHRRRDRPDAGADRRPDRADATGEHAPDTCGTRM